MAHQGESSCPERFAQPVDSRSGVQRFIGDVLRPVIVEGSAQKSCVRCISDLQEAVCKCPGLGIVSQYRIDDCGEQARVQLVREVRGSPDGPHFVES